MPPRRLARQGLQGAGFGVEGEEVLAAHQVERAYAHHFRFFDSAGRIGHRALEARHLRGSDHFFQEEQLQFPQFAQARQGARLGDAAGPLAAARPLGGHQRRVDQALGISGHLPHHAEQLAEIADAHGQAFFELLQLAFVALEAVAERIAAAHLLGEFAARLVEQLPPLVAPRLEAGDALGVAAFGALGLVAHHVQQLRQGVRLGLLRGSCDLRIGGAGVVPRLLGLRGKRQCAGGEQQQG